MANFNWVRTGIIVAVVGAGGWFLIHHFTAKKAPPPEAVIPITPGTVAVKDIPVYVRGLGTVQAFNSVSIKSRVDGQITQVLFTEGQEVKAGDSLFQIDPRPYQAALEQAEANFEKDRAQLHGATLDLNRYAKLAEPGYQTRQSVDDQKATVGQVTGTAKADQALIDSSQLNLDYSNIKAPFAGRTGARLVDIGNFIQAAQGTSLVTVTQIKPIFVSFTVPQESLDQIRQNQAQGALTVVAYGQDDKTVLAQGKLTLINNQVDTTTGTIQLKATFDNDDERLWPGEFVNARLIVSVKKNALTVPAQTVMQGPNGAYAYTIKPDNTVQRQDVQIALTQDGEAVVEKGLAANDNVVVDGQYRLTQGTKVKTDQGQPQPKPAS